MSSVIKASTAESGPSVAFAFDELGASSGSNLSRARRDAATILAQAETQADVLRRHAQEQGRTAALSAAEKVLEEKVARQLDTLVPALHAAVDALVAARGQWLAHWERAALGVATAIAARVIRREVERTPEITLALVKEALELAAGSAEVQLRMHPDDLAVLGRRVERLAGELGRLGDVQIAADPTVTAGGCRLETRFGTIDQQFEAQLARIEQELT